jgi:hypothetical protein
MTETTFEQVEAPKFKNSKEYIAHLSTVEGDTLNKQEVIDTLTGFSNKGNGQRRGQLAGLELETMSDEQLKRELINAKSVLYKAQQRKAAIETIEKNEARVEAATAEKAKRTPEVEATEDAPVESDEVYANSDAANEL